MADKPKDHKDATFLSRRLGKHADINRVGILKQAFVEEGIERSSAVSVAAMAGFAFALGGGVGGIVGDLSQPTDFLYTPDAQTEYSDQGAGYEVIKYAADEPAVMIVRDGDGAFRLYEGNGETFRLLDDSESWALSAKIASILRDREAQLNDVNSDVPENVFLPEFYTVDGLSAPWSGGDDIFRRVEGLNSIELSVPQLADRYNQEASEWSEARGAVVAGEYNAEISPDNLGERQKISDEQFVQGGKIGGGLALLLLFGMIGRDTARGYRRRVREARNP